MVGLPAFNPPSPIQMHQSLWSLPIGAIPLGPVGFNITFSLACAALPVMAMWRKREYLIDKTLRDEGFRAWFENVDQCLAILAAVIITRHQVYNPDRWTNGDPEFTLAAACFVTVTAVAVYSKLLKSRASAREKKSIAKLEADAKVLTATRNWLVRINELIDRIVGEKRDRLNALRTESDVTHNAIVSAADPASQILIILTGLHEFLQSQMEPGSSLRLGIYFRSGAERDALVRGYAWNGKTENCFSTQSADFLKITRTNNCLSILAQCYHSEDGMLIVPDCEQASRTPGSGFTYLYPAQAAAIRSLLAFRFSPSNSRDEPWIIYLDTNQNGFFEVAKKADYKLILDRIAHRISFELVTLDLTRKAAGR